MKKTVSVFLSVLLVFLSICIPAYAEENIYQNNAIEHAIVHDPSIFRDKDGKYYVVGSHFAMGESEDLIHWKDDGYTYDNDYLTADGNGWKEVLSEPLEWTSRYQLAVPEKYHPDALEYNDWAHDIIYNETMGKYCLYGAVSVWGATSSAIWLCVSDNVKGPYEYVDTFIYSGITNPKLEHINNVNNNILDEDGSIHEDPVIKALSYRYTNIPELIEKGYINGDMLDITGNYRPYKWFNFYGAYYCWGEDAFPNCIDPTVFTDKDGEMWLVYGSYSGGCFLQKLNNETGLPDYDYMKAHKKDGYDIYYGKRLSNTNDGTEGTGEGPYIVYDSVSEYYYFFLTYGGLAGDGGYNIREYRSKTPDGPYLDKMGNAATDYQNTGLKLDANYQFECQKTVNLSGGHSSCLLDTDGSLYQVYHSRYSADNGIGFNTKVHKMARTKDGWAVMLPYEYQGEKITAVNAADIPGTYQFIDSTNMTHRKESSSSKWESITVPTQYISLKADGTITGARDYACTTTNARVSSKAISGTWKLTDGGAYAQFKLGSVTYGGVFTKQKDESAAGREVIVFTAAGTDNSTIWGAQHTEHIFDTPAMKKATFSSDGKTYTSCSLCGAEQPDTATTIHKAKNVKLSATSYVYSGQYFKPSVKLTDSKGAVIPVSSYTVVYSNNKNVGTATVKVTLKGNYAGTKTLHFTVKPKGTTISKLTAAKKSFKVTVKKNVTQTTGYQVQYALDKNFKKSVKSVTFSNKTTVGTVKGLKAKKKYFVRVRTYKTVGGKKVYSDWSNVKSVRTKK